MPDLTREPLRAALIRLSLPLMGSMLLETCFNIINGYWVGRLGTTALAAVNISSFSIWLLFALAGIVATGSNAVIAQQLGAKRGGRAIQAARVGVLAAVVLGVAIAVPVQLLAAPFLHWQAGSGPQVQGAVELGSVYLKTVFAFAPVFCVNETFSAILRAHGDMRTPLKVYSLGFGLNFLLDPLLILGAGPIPGQGVWGAALASGISFGSMTLIYGAIVWRRARLLRPAGPVSLMGYWLLRIVRIGIPPSLAGVFFSLIYILITPVVGAFGPAALAALGIGHRVESLGYLVCYGLSLATITLVGQNVGARKWDRARQAGWEGCRLAVFVMLFVAVLMFWLAPYAGRVFSDDPLVLQFTAGYVRVLALGQVPMGINLILLGVFSGAGRPLPPTILSVLSASLRVPLAHLFARRLGYGVMAIWIVIACLTFLQALANLAVFIWKPRWLMKDENF